MPSAVVAACLYIAVSVLQGRRSSKRSDASALPLYTLAILALVLHGYAAVVGMRSPEGINFGLMHVMSLIFWLINLTLLVSFNWRPLQNLMVIIFPWSALAVLAGGVSHSSTRISGELSTGMLLHIGTSVLAYAVLTIAACQAATIAYQDRQLHRRQTRGLVALLPPLQLMETMLFEIIWIGIALLTVAIGTGLVFLDDMFAQHLAHKTVLSLSAWSLFATLLWGRHFLGWRSQVAARFTLIGFAFLMLAYAGSKLVLETLLTNG
ncbi:MAG: cytochrome c biogenesis protein CcsA [Pseudomonadota bacterium]